MDRIPDPYRELGVLRGATDAQVKAAHRRLAKRFHPDAPEGDHDRFLAIQEAYQLLSDPLRRRDWDTAHAPGPVRAGDPAKPRTRAGGPPRARTAGARSGGAGSTGKRGTAGTGAAGSGGAAGESERTGGAWSASDREPASRSTTWSASGVPWWEDFAPRDRSAASAPGAAGTGTGGAPKARPTGGRGPAPASGATAGDQASAGGTGGGRPAADATSGRTTAQRSPDDVDVYSRSSGAAWSMAARRYFRKGEAELPKGGAWTYRGTQVVTGAEARKVAAEQAAERRRAAEELLRSRAPGPSSTSRQAFSHDPASPAVPPAPAPRPAPAPPAARPTATPARADDAPAALARPPATSRSEADPGPSLLGRVRRALRLR